MALGVERRATCLPCWLQTVQHQLLAPDSEVCCSELAILAEESGRLAFTSLAIRWPKHEAGQRVIGVESGFADAVALGLVNAQRAELREAAQRHQRLGPGIVFGPDPVAGCVESLCGNLCPVQLLPPLLFPAPVFFFF